MLDSWCSALDMKQTTAEMKAVLRAVEIRLLQESIKNTCPNESPWWWQVLPYSSWTFNVPSRDFKDEIKY